MESPVESPVCPICQKNDFTFKVQQIYKESLSIFNKKEPHPFTQAILEHMRELKALPNPESHEFTSIFAPPSGKNDMIRFFHPDLVMGLLVAGLLYILYVSYNQNIIVFYIFLVLLILGFILYLSIRKGLMQQYLNGKAEAEQPAVTPYQAMEHWMKLYYCARDGIIFEPGKEDQIPLDKMKSFLMHKQD